MADTVDPAPTLSPADEPEEPRAAAPAEQADEPQADAPEEPHDAVVADEAEEAEEPQAAAPKEPHDAVVADEAEEAEEPREVRGVPEGAAESREEETEPDRGRSVTELFEQLGRDLSELGMSETQLEAARNLPEVRRAAREIAISLVVVIATLTAFAFLNVAAVEGLSKVVATWVAAVVLAAVWIGVAGVLFFGFMGRARRWLLWIVPKAPPTEAIEDLERERDDDGRAARATLEHLGPALATQIALAAVPKAGEVAGDVAGDVVEVGGSVLQASDETIEVVAEQLPGGGVVNQVWDLALMPGRLGVRVVTTVLRRGRPPD
jgi:hypothetical protein